MKKENWIWMPHPAHFICSNDCKFKLATYVGKYIVSTVGEYLPDLAVIDIFAMSRGVDLKERGDDRQAEWLRKNGYEKLGMDRTYETMVFKAVKDKNHTCCPYRITPSELDFMGYNDADSATKGHLRLCRKWAKK